MRVETGNTVLMQRAGILLWLIVAVFGCSKSAPAPAAEAAKNIPKLLAFYGQYQRSHNGTGPPDQAALEKFVRDRSPADLAQRGVEPGDLDQLFVSERDREPLVVRFGLRLADEKNGPQPVVHERVGVGGKRFVGFMNRRVEEVDSDRAAALGLNVQ